LPSVTLAKKKQALPEISHDSAAKEAIFAALSAFNADDDERDDTYDTADIGGAVDIATPEKEPTSIVAPLSATPDAILYALWTKSTPAERAVLFARDSATRRGHQRMDLKKKTGYSDEAIEGWAVMLERDPAGRILKELERKYGEGRGGSLNKGELERTKYQRNESEEGGGEESGIFESGSGRGRGGFRGNRGRAGGSGDATREMLSSPKERARKEKNKAKVANHHRKEGHARKMARGFSGAPA